MTDGAVPTLSSIPRDDFFIATTPPSDSPEVGVGLAPTVIGPPAGKADPLEALAKRGDRAALEEISRRELPRVERLLLRILGPRADLEDLVQIVFVETLRALPRFRGDSKLSTFIGGITVHVAKRAMRPSPWWRLRSDSSEDESVDPAPGPDRQAVAAEQLRRVRAALERVSPKKRIAFLLWSLEGMEVPEIAALMDASPSATRSRIFYAQRELKRCAAKDPYLAELVAEDE